MKEILNKEVRKLKKSFKRKLKSILKQEENKKMKINNGNETFNVKRIEFEQNNGRLSIILETDPTVSKNQNELQKSEKEDHNDKSNPIFKPKNEDITKSKHIKKVNEDSLPKQEERTADVIEKLNTDINGNKDIQFSKIERTEILSTNKNELEMNNKTEEVINNEQTIIKKFNSDTNINENNTNVIRSKYISELFVPPKYVILTDNIENDRPIIDRVNKLLQEDCHQLNAQIDIFLFEHNSCSDPNKQNTVKGKKGFAFNDLFMNLDEFSKKYKQKFINKYCKNLFKIDTLIKDVVLTSKNMVKDHIEENTFKDYTAEILLSKHTNEEILINNIFLKNEIKENFEAAHYLLRKIFCDVIFPFFMNLQMGSIITGDIMEIASFYYIRVLNCYKNAEERILLFQILVNFYWIIKKSLRIKFFLISGFFDYFIWHLYLFNDDEIKHFLENIEIIIHYFSNSTKAPIDLFEYLFKDPYEKYTMCLMDTMNIYLRAIFKTQKLIESIYNVSFENYLTFDTLNYSFTTDILKKENKFIWLKCLSKKKDCSFLAFNDFEIIVDLDEKKIIELKLHYNDDVIGGYYNNYNQILWNINNGFDNFFRFDLKYFKETLTRFPDSNPNLSSEYNLFELMMTIIRRIIQ